MLRQTVDLIAATFALCAFALAVILGQLAQQPPARVLLVALIAMVVCRVVGLLAGRAAVVALEEFLRDFEDERPVPKLETFERRSDDKRSSSSGSPAEASESLQPARAAA